MSNQLQIRFESPRGGAFLFLNGFLLFGPEDTGRAASQASPFVRPRANVVELFTQRPDASAVASIVELSEDGPEAASTRARLEVRQEEPRQLAEFALDREVPEFGWHRAEEVGDLEEHRMALYQAVRSFGDLLEKGPDEALLGALRMKHSEIAQAAGVTSGEIDEGLLTGLGQLRARPGFRVDIASAEDFLPLSPAYSGIVTLRRQSGGDALQIIDQIANPGFGVAMARLEGRWQIVR